MTRNLLNICPDIFLICQSDFPIGKKNSSECKRFNFYTFQKVPKLNPHFWWPKNYVNILKNCKLNVPKRCINQSSTFTWITYFVISLCTFFSKYTFFEIKLMKAMCSKLTFLHLKTGVCLIWTFSFFVHHLQLRTDQMKPKSSKLYLIFISKQFLIGFTSVLPEDYFSGLTP